METATVCVEQGYLGSAIGNPDRGTEGIGESGHTYDL